jgi:hypothetical protein
VYSISKVKVISCLELIKNELDRNLHLRFPCLVTCENHQWVRIEDPDINLPIYSQLIFNKGAPNTRCRKDNLFNKCCWENWISTCRRLKLDPCLSPYTKINSKWIEDLNIRPEALKQLQEAVRNTLEQIGVGNDFLNRTQKAQHLRERMNKWDCIKLTYFCTAKGTFTRLESSQNGRKSLPATHLIRH